GSGLRQIPIDTGGSRYFAKDPVWSPNGNKIALALFLPQNGAQDIYTMNADGTGLTQVTASPTFHDEPHWGTHPLAPYTHARHASLLAPVVPAYHRCSLFKNLAPPGPRDRQDPRDDPRAAAQPESRTLSFALAASLSIRCSEILLGPNRAAPSAPRTLSTPC